MNYETLNRNFENHGFITEYFEEKEQVVAYLKEHIKGATVGIGGSMTAKELNLDKALSDNNRVIWHWNEPGRNTLMAVRESDIYICSANGVSETGELVNIDGTGNRVSMVLFGPERLYVIIGRNKIVPTLEDALHRAKNVSAPRNARRLKLNTPCAVNSEARCYNCNSPQRICKGTVILERPMNGMEVTLLFVNEDLGF